MNLHVRIAWSVGLSLAILSPGRTTVAAPAASAKETGITVLARGPVHEAFAQPANTNPQPPPVVPQKPLAPIPEEPPDQKPKGKDVQWIPGYWAWDTEKNEFLWVSGVWRATPPERRWVPGYWSKADSGYRWVSGFWASAQKTELPYLSTPPASFDNGPSSPAPDNDSTYVPGCWIFRDYQYYWRPGFWNPCYAGWVWNPSCYSWTPGGYVFVGGYWDYCLENRGLLFAPVCFGQSLWTTPGWCYTPSCVVNCSGLFDSLFFAPGCSCYCFGNYYSPFFRACGFRPWCVQGPRCFDPLFGYCGWINRANPLWAQGLCHTFHDRFRGTAPAPALTLAAQASGVNLVTPLNHLGAGVPLVHVAPSQLSVQRTAAIQLQQQSTARLRTEASITVSAAPSGRSLAAAVLGTLPLLGGTTSFRTDPVRVMPSQVVPRLPSFVPSYMPHTYSSRPAMSTFGGSRSGPSFSGSLPGGGRSMGGHR